ncbi:MAG TPA: ABC transporter ATP-binding protein [Ignavibacteriales bacterium]|nr:ABC transporter ATP-binding protein [Ignavibacteriales bacterium]
MENVIEIKNLKKIYTMGDVEVKALAGVDLTIKQGEFVAIMGASGSGKSTLLNLLGCLDKPTSGEYYLDEINTSRLSGKEYADIRNQKIGFVFQGFNLLSRTSALENVELPLMYDRTGKIKDPKKKAIEVLERVGLADRMHHVPNQLSGGQQQRVAIARALINEPAIILADEPTGNLDSKTSVEVFSLFQELNNEGITIVLITHERDFANFGKRIVELRDGLIIRDFEVKNRLDPLEVMKGIMLNAEAAG